VIWGIEMCSSARLLYLGIDFLASDILMRSETSCTSSGINASASAAAAAADLVDAVVSETVEEIV
jgi:hypothetical protein